MRNQITSLVIAAIWASVFTAILWAQIAVSAVG